MATIIDGKKIAKKINARTQAQVAELIEQKIQPGIAVILVGDDPASKLYTRNKQRKAEKLGMKSVLESYPQNVSQQEILAAIMRLNKDDSINAILVQAPLPPQIDQDVITSAIVPEKDVDGFHPQNLGRLFANQQGNYPVACTPKGIMTMLQAYDVPLTGQRAVIIGRSILVGKPMAALLMNANATVSVAGSHTTNLASLTRQADILISATGVGHLIKPEFVQAGATVIDVGINHDQNGNLIGDVDFDAVMNVAGKITPVPGGVGPMTIATLMQQTVELAKWSLVNG